MALRRFIPIMAAIAACYASLAPAATPPLTTLHAIHSLSNAEAQRHLPVEFEATVLYFRSYELTLFVGDGDEAVYVHIDTPLELQPGDRIVVRGNTYADFRPGVMGRDITFLHHGKMPAPAPATFAAMISAKLDCRYVAVRGRVRSAEVVLSSNVAVTQLELAIPGAYVTVTMDNSDPAQLKGWLDSEVEVTGVAAGRFDTKMQQVGILLHSTAASNLRVLRPAAQDPWAIRAAPLDQVINDYNVEEQTPQIRVEGTLTYYYPSEMAILQDGERSIQVYTAQIDPLHIGERVEAIGIPYVDDGFQTIRLATIRSTGTSAPIAPAVLDWNELATGKHAFDLVSIEGTVVVQVREEGQDICVVSNEGHLFSAVINRPYGYNWTGNRPAPLRSIAPGSTVRVTGVAILEDGNPFNGALAFSVLMRSTDDVAVVADPPWLNVPHLMFLVGLLLAATLAAGTRGWLIARRMRRQTLGLAYLEQRRSRILESMHASRPLNEILEQVTELVSFRLDGAPSWCELCDGTIAGNRPEGTSDLLGDVECALMAPGGQMLGMLHASICARPAGRAHAGELMGMGAELATLAIETSHLHSDLVHRSEFDLLTDVQNRFSLEKSLDARICAARQTGSTFGLIYIDLNHFKQVNDNYGHHAGDIYLQLASERMKRQLRPGDTMARVGGDEFAVLVPDVRHRAAIEDIAERLAGCFDEPFVLESISIRGSASIGIALYPDDANTRDGLLNAADVAMYAAKHARREPAPSPADEQEREAAHSMRT